MNASTHLFRLVVGDWTYRLACARADAARSYRTFIKWLQKLHQSSQLRWTRLINGLLQIPATGFTISLRGYNCIQARGRASPCFSLSVLVRGFWFGFGLMHAQVQALSTIFQEVRIEPAAIGIND
jgi:hypothetical protein